MKCIQCGALIYGSSPSCGYCGTSQAPPATQAQAVSSLICPNCHTVGSLTSHQLGYLCSYCAKISGSFVVAAAQPAVQAATAASHLNQHYQYSGINWVSAGLPVSPFTSPILTVDPSFEFDVPTPAPSGPPACTICSIELSSYLDAYYGTNDEHRGMCVKCRTLDASAST